MSTHTVCRKTECGLVNSQICRMQHTNTGYGILYEQQRCYQHAMDVQTEPRCACPTISQDRCNSGGIRDRCDCHVVRQIRVYPEGQRIPDKDNHEIGTESNRNSNAEKHRRGSETKRSASYDRHHDRYFHSSRREYKQSDRGRPTTSYGNHGERWHRRRSYRSVERTRNIEYKRESSERHEKSKERYGIKYLRTKTATQKHTRPRHINGTSSRSHQRAGQKRERVSTTMDENELGGHSRMVKNESKWRRTNSAQNNVEQTSKNLNKHQKELVSNMRIHHASVIDHEETSNAESLRERIARLSRDIDKMVSDLKEIKKKKEEVIINNSVNKVGQNNLTMTSNAHVNPIEIAEESNKEDDRNDIGNQPLNYDDEPNDDDEITKEDEEILASMNIELNRIDESNKNSAEEKQPDKSIKSNKTRNKNKATKEDIYKDIIKKTTRGKKH